MAVSPLDDTFLPLTAQLIGLSQQEGMSLSVGGPGWQYGPQPQFGPPAEVLQKSTAEGTTAE